ncbi:MAG: phosphatidate cytidylyltransferase [Chromatiaceae bacterium]|nr:phosphatidate cytidylyltransferase [Chromatiaceae bacterium]MCP5314152.1 phosphatidate cytidylyltransferase [Chromatiaceae bacterium]
MLWQRVLTALVLIPLVVAGILKLDTVAFALVLGAFVMLGALEMARLAQLHQRPAQVLFAVGTALALGLAWHFLHGAALQAVQWAMALWWAVTTVMLFSRRRELRRIEGSRPLILVLGALVLVSAWISVVDLHRVRPGGPALVLYLFVLIWVADSGAYFAGRAFGRRKLSPFVSPGKTWAGVFGALAGAALSAVALVQGGWAGAATVPGMVLLVALVTLLSIGGDLWESRLKREAGVKDSGQLLPGHGGVLDRIDSLLAAAPVFALGAVLLGTTT